MTAAPPVVWVAAGADTAERWVRALRLEELAAGALAWSAPQPLPWAGWASEAYDLVLFTSRHAPEALPGAVGEGRPAACVGAGTAEAAAAAGFHPALVGDAGGAELADTLRARMPEVRRVLFLAGREARREAVDALEQAGVRVDVEVVYAMEPRAGFAAEVAAAPEPDALVVGSPRAADALADALAAAGRELPEGVGIAVLGAVTAERARSRLHRYVAVAARTDAPGLAACVREILRAGSPDERQP